MIIFEWSPPLPFVLSDFEGWESSFQSFREPLQESVRSVLSPSIRQNFNVGGRPSWTALDADTILRNRRSGTPLVKSGRLADTASSSGIWSYTDDEAFISNMGNAEYGVYHQTGFNPGTGAVPAREWAVFQQQDEERVEEIFFKWIDDQLQKHGWD